MTDLEKLQKIKERILSDQHPFFTSAPKVEHLLSLRVPASFRSAVDSNASSGSAGDQERPLSSVPLVDRLSSPKFHDGYPVDEERQKQDGAERTSQEEPSHQGKEDNPEASHGEMSTEDAEPVGAHGWYSPKYDFGNNVGQDSSPTRESSNNEGSRPPGNGWKYGENGRNQHGAQRGTYHHYGNRRFSGNDQRQYDNNRNFDRRNDFSSNHPDDRDRQHQRPYGRGGYHQHYGSRPYYDRRNEQGKGSEASQQHQQPAESSEAHNSVDETKTSAMDITEEPDRSLTEEVAAIDTKMETPVTEVTSPSTSVAPPQSATESIATIPAPVSPPRSDVPMDSRSLRSGQGPKSVGNRSPTRNDSFRNVQNRDYDRDVRMRSNQYQQRDNDHRFNQQEGRQRAEGYHKYQPQSRNYERQPLQRDDRGYTAQYRQSFPPPPIPPTDRFVPRDQGYAEEPLYTRRDYRPGPDWESRRRDERPIDNRLYDRDRDMRDMRGPAPFPTDSRMQPKMSHLGGSTGPPRAYPPQVDRDGAGRGVTPRLAPDPYLSHPQEVRGGGYDRAPYQSPHGAPSTGTYSRVRPRSMSPPRRDYRQDERPPNKRQRPEDSYGALPPGNAYPPHYAPLTRGAPDYPDRRPFGGPSQSGYYRADDRPPRY
ncbi:hypothetical protein FRC17_010870 [Serendipita sp. 399]|nr:hypothetical protein FRC17_010870 [Serendipita sp. 399]